MKRWYRWELALLLGLCAALLWGAWSAQQQEALSRKMIRLHVIAHSDSPQEQALKLQVRDAVLDYTTNVLQRSDDMEQAQEQLQAALPQIEAIACNAVAEAGYGHAVTASLGKAQFPLKEYDGFSLPAGEYTALRLVIGDGAGENWWCVVFPPLCTQAVTAEQLHPAISSEDMALMEREGTYNLAFRSVEIWSGIKALFESD